MNKLQEKLKEALSKVDKQYTLKAEVKIAAENNVNTLFEKLISLRADRIRWEGKDSRTKKKWGFYLRWKCL